MPNSHMILAILLAIVPIALAQQPSDSPGGGTKTPALGIEQVLQLSTPEELIKLDAQRRTTLASLLTQATDEASARRVLPDAQICYLEMSLIEARISLLALPTDQIRARLRPLTEPILKTQEEIFRQAQRIQDSPPLEKILEPVVRQLHLVEKHRANSIANSMISQLQTVRSQIELYKLQHEDKAPDFRNHGWSQLTKATRAGGQIDANGEMGPYLSSIPENLLNNHSRVLISRSTPKKDFHYAGGDCGFVYDESTGKFWALDAQGKIWNESRDTQADVR